MHPPEVMTIEIFTKAPELDRVKTRLAESVGAQKALQIYLQLLQRVCETVAAYVSHCGDKRSVMPCLRVAGDPRNDEILALRKMYNFQQAQQCRSANLGERLVEAIIASLQQGRSTVILGGDSVAVDEAYLASAVSQLSHADLVVGPAEDGGFILLGVSGRLNQGAAADQVLALKARLQSLLCHIPWGAPQVLSALLRAAQRLELSVAPLEPRWDVDRVEDLRRLPWLLLDDE